MVDALVWVLALSAAAASVLVVLRTDVLHGALALVAVLLSLAGIYAALGAMFIAAVQVAVYAGAVMILFLFAIMTLESRRESSVPVAGRRIGSVAAGLAGVTLLGALLASGRPVVFDADRAALAPTLSGFARRLFRDDLLAFEGVGVLLLIALVAVVVLAGRRDVPKVNTGA